MDAHAWSFPKPDFTGPRTPLKDHPQPPPPNRPWDAGFQTQSFDPQSFDPWDLDRAVRQLLPDAEVLGPGQFVYGFQNPGTDHPGLVIQIFSWSPVASLAQGQPSVFITLRALTAAPYGTQDPHRALAACNHWNAHTRGPSATLDQVEGLGEPFTGIVLNAHLNLSHGLTDALLPAFLQEAIQGAMAFWERFMETEDGEE